MIYDVYRHQHFDSNSGKFGRIKALGNASLPQISEQIGRAVVKFLEYAI